MKTNKPYLFITLLAISVIGNAQATYNECRGNCGPREDPSTQYEQDQGQAQVQGQDQAQHQGQAQGQSQSADSTAVAGAIAVSGASASNENINLAQGGAGGRGGDGGAGGTAVQGQSQSSDNSNSSNNSASQYTSLNIEAAKNKRYANNVNAFAPAIYSSSACTAGGVSGAASALGVGVSLGGAKQDPQCQIRENARILAGLDPGLAVQYLCSNPGVDIGKVLGGACRYSPPEVAQPIEVAPPEVIPPVVTVESVKGR